MKKLSKTNKENSACDPLVLLVKKILPSLDKDSACDFLISLVKRFYQV